MFLALALITAAALIASVFGDAATASAIAGIFSVLNTGLSGWLLRRQAQTRDVAGSAALAAAAAAESALEAARVAKSIGGAIRHEDPIIIHRETPPES